MTVAPTGPDVAAPGRLRIVTLDDFVAVQEPGADALLGDSENALIPENGDVMFYGDGGAGKTTLVVDLGCHLAAGDDWLGIPVVRPVRVLLIESEGPRAQFRAKLRRKREHWNGSPMGDRIAVLEAPWAELTLAEEGYRVELAAMICEHEVDVVVIGPVTRSGMNEAGTLQEVRDFMVLIADVRRRAGRPVSFILIHHESKAGKVSGAWEGAGDTLLHVQGQGKGHTRLFVQKARWSSVHHATTFQLVWTEGEGFAVSDDPERAADTIADEILNAARANGGASWREIEKSTGGKNDRKRTIRDRLLAGGRLIDTGGKGGMKLWDADDPALPALPDELCPAGGTPGAHLASGPGAAGESATVPLCPDVVGAQGIGAHSTPPQKTRPGT